MQNTLLKKVQDFVRSPLDLYIPEEKMAFELTKIDEIKTDLMEYLCKKREIQFVVLPFKTKQKDTEYANDVKAAFRRRNIFLRSDTEEDVKYIRKCYST